MTALNIPPHDRRQKLVEAAKELLAIQTSTPSATHPDSKQYFVQRRTMFVLGRPARVDRFEYQRPERPSNGAPS